MLIALLPGLLVSQKTSIVPIKGANSLLVGGVISTGEEIKIAVTSNTSEQVIISHSPEGTFINSRLKFPHKFFVLNTFAWRNLQFTLGEVYPKVNIKEVSFISKLDKTGNVVDYKLFTVEQGFSEVFDATIIDDNTIAIGGMGEIKVVTAYTMFPASAMLPQGLLILATPDLTFKKAFYITFPEQDKYLWRIYRVEATGKGDLVIAGEVYTEWDKERNSPLNTMPFVARVSQQGNVKWALTIPKRGHINDLLISQDGTIWLVHTNVKLSGTHFTQIGNEKGEIIKTLFINGFSSNNCIFENDGNIICAGKIQKGKDIEAGLAAIDITENRGNLISVSKLIGNLRPGTKLSPMDVTVFTHKQNIGVVGSLLGGTGDKAILISTEISLNKIKSTQKAQALSIERTSAKQEGNVSMETTKLVEIKEIQGNLTNEKIRIK